MVSLFIVCGSFMLAYNVGYWLAGIGRVLFAAVYSSWAWKRAELFPISGESASASRRGNWVAGVLAFFGVWS